MFVLTRNQLARALAVELLGTALLVAVVIGSGIMASRLSPHDVGLQLFENAAATAAGSISTKERFGGGLWPAEVVATIGLLLTIFALVRSRRAGMVAPAVGCYIGAAYFFTASTSFANPAVTTGRIFSNTFAGIEPGSALMFILMQLIGGAVAVLLVRLLYPDVAEFAGDVVVPHETEQDPATAEESV